MGWQAGDRRFFPLADGLKKVSCDFSLIHFAARPEQKVLAQKRAKVPPLRERCVLSLEAAQRIIDEWIKEHS